MISCSQWGLFPYQYNVPGYSWSDDHGWQWKQPAHWPLDNLTGPASALLVIVPKPNDIPKPVTNV